jgi:Ser/Thr protein kinase RdoA (MazF antagonist)
MLNGRPAGLVERIDGVAVEHPDLEHCEAVGAALARLHLASQRYRARLTNRRGPAWWRQAARAVQPFLSAEQRELLTNEIKFQTGYGKGKLPKARSTAISFCDNVLFDGHKVAGIIDFGFAATDFLAYDLAITANDWCVVDDSGTLDPHRCEELVRRTKRFAPSARTSMRNGRRCCAPRALRFWLSRLYDLHLPRPGSSRTHTIPRNSSASCGSASSRPSARIMLDTRMDDIREIPFTRHEGRRGVAWLRASYALFRRAPVPWLVLVLSYYFVLFALQWIPFAGGLALLIMKPVFSVGFLAAGGTRSAASPRRRAICSRAFAPTCGRWCRSAC